MEQLRRAGGLGLRLHRGLVSTDDGYADRNGRLHDYGDLKYGLTGDSHGWRHDCVELSSYAGFEERGWFTDDFAVTGGGATTWSDDVEGADNNGWTLEAATFTNTAGAGWDKDSGTQVKAHYYLVEWRNYDVGLVPTKPFRECFELLPAEPFSEYCTDIAAQAPVSTFTDAQGWYPGIEIRPNGSLFFRDIDASTVVPSVGTAPYTTRVVDSNGNPRPDLYGADLGSNIVLGTGNPADAGVSFHIVPPTP